MTEYDYLEHYGVKGMKWGVRRTPEQLGHRTYSAKKGDVVLKKGTTFQRIATGSNSGYTKGVYTSYRSSDKDLYKGVLGRMRVSSLYNSGNEVFLNELTLTSKKDIRIPNRETRLDTFKSLYEQDKKGVLAFINEHENSRYGKSDILEINVNSKSKVEDAYRKFNDALAMGSNSANKNVIQRYYYELSKLGYNAIADENDIRLSTFKANAPIILFNTKDTIKSTTSRELTASEVFSAYKRSIGKKTVRQILEKRGVGREKLDPDTYKKAQKYAKQLEKDKFALDASYTLKDLAKDWSENRLSSGQIEKVSRLMSTGKTHDDAVTEVIGMGNVVADYFLDKMNL